MLRSLRVIWSEWKRNQAELWMSILYVTTCWVKKGLSLYSIILTAKIFESSVLGVTPLIPVNIQIMRLEIVLVVLIALMYAKIHIAYIIDVNLQTKIDERYNNQVLDVDHSLFKEMSPANVQVGSEFVDNLITMMERTTDTIVSLGQLILILFYIWYYGGSIIFWVAGLLAIGTCLLKHLFNKYTDICVKRHKAVQRKRQETENIIMNFLGVRTKNTQEWHRNRFHGILMELRNQKIKFNNLHSMVLSVFESVDSVGIIAIVIYCVKQIGADILSVAKSMSLIAYVGQLTEPIGKILDWVHDVSFQMSSEEFYKKTMEYRKEYKGGNLELDEITDGLTVSHASFDYDKTSNTIKDVSITAKAGQSIGICGPSGSAKSTLMMIILGMYKLKRGCVKIDGHDISSLTRESFHKMVGYVSQEIVLLPGTIMDNLLYGLDVDRNNPEVLERVRYACELSDILRFIEKLPNGFNTDVGPRGMKLSGGEKQRLALASVLIRDPKIIIMDEATSAQDNKTERNIKNAIASLKGKTIITIAHRLTTIENCDNIYYMEKGRIIEHGTDKSLMELHGKYYAMKLASKE